MSYEQHNLPIDCNPHQTTCSGNKLISVKSNKSIYVKGAVSMDCNKLKLVTADCA